MSVSGTVTVAEAVTVQRTLGVLVSSDQSGRRCLASGRALSPLSVKSVSV